MLTYLLVLGLIPYSSLLVDVSMMICLSKMVDMVNVKAAKHQHVTIVTRGFVLAC